MKKIVLSIAGVMAAAAFAPEASAVPSFARQTGMACSACHQQHYPVLNGFGQAFKAAGYTMMGAQEKVEGEHLSIPSVLNASMLLKARYVTDDTAGATAAGQNTTGNGQWQIPDEFSLFFGGRVAENIGFMFEGNTAAAGLVAGFKLPIVFDMGSVKLQVVPYLTDALGAGYGFEQSSTGAVRGVRWAEHRSDISAAQYVGIGAGQATGLAFVAISDMGYINFSKFTPTANLANPGAAFTPTAAQLAAGAAANPGTTSKLENNYLRIAATPTMGDWAMHIGAQFMSGGNALAGTVTKATALDFQGHGQIGGNDLGVYATYASAGNDVNMANITDAGFAADGVSPIGTGATLFSIRNNSKAWTIGADYSVIPHVLHLGAAYMNANDGAVITAAQAAAGRGNDMDSITLMAVYDLTQNVALHVNHSQRSGNRFNPGTVGGAGRTGKQLTTFLLEAAW